MSASQVSSCGRWTQDCQRRRPGCRLGTGWWLWLGRAWKGWAMKRQCPRSGRRAPASRSLSLTLRLTASSTWCELRGGGWRGGRKRAGLGWGEKQQGLSYLPLFQVRLSPLLFLESTEAPDSPQDTGSASLVETKDPPVEDTTVPCGFRQCFLYPGPGGGYGFRLSCVASGPHLFISQVTDAPGTLDLLNHLPLDKSSSASLPEPQYTQQTFLWCSKLYIPPFHQVTLGGSAARAGLQMGDVILEVNGYPMGGENDLERLQQLAEAEPPLCLKLAARSQQGLEAWIPPGSGEVRKERWMDCELPEEDRG